MEKNKKQKNKRRIIYDIIPPHLIEDIVLVEKKVSMKVKAAYFFLKTSKYGSAVLILGVAFFGGLITLGFSPKTEITEIYPTRFEGNWQNMEKALSRETSDKAFISEFNSENSTGIVKSEEDSGEPKPEEETLFPSNEEAKEPETLNPESLEITGLEGEIENQNLEEATVFEEEATNEAEQENFKEDAKPTNSDIILETVNPEEEIITETEIKTEIEEPVIPNFQEAPPPILELQEEIIPQSEQAPLSSFVETSNDKNLDKGISFFEKTKNMFSISEARAEELADSNSQDGPAQNEESAYLSSLEEETTEEERFEDYSGIIILPDVDGNLLFEEDNKKETLEKETIFNNQYNAVYSNFLIPSQKGELKNLKIGFSFASPEKKNKDDEIIVSWSLDNNNWNDASEFVLNKTYSNKDNGGYFYIDIFALNDLSKNETILTWEDLKNIKVKFSYLTNNNEENYVPFFLDAIWLEAKSEKLDKELKIKGKIEILSNKKDFKINEDPEFKFKYKKEKGGLIVSVGEALGIVDYWKDVNLTAEIIGPNRKAFKIPSEELGNFSDIFILEKSGEISMKLKQNTKFKPGLYKIILKIEERENIEMFEKDFTWGVLAINVNKSIYLPGEEVYLQMGVLRDDGHTICDANLTLSIINSKTEEAILSTADGTIEYSGQCNGNNVTDVPDYFAYYQVGDTGIYEMKLTNLDNGYEITDTFEVRESAPFEVERIGPTRIYPPAEYGMILRIKVNQDFAGEIRELVPEGFMITNQESRIKNQESGEFIIYDLQFIIQEQEDKSQALVFQNIDLKTNDEFEIKYTFDAPDVSPYVYLLGPLKIGNFEEIREWQIASDSITIGATISNSGNQTNTTGYSFNHTGDTNTKTLVVVVTGYDSSNTDAIVTSVKFNSVDLTKAEYYRGGSGYVSIWYLYDPPTGTAYSVAVTLADTNTDSQATAVNLVSTTAPSILVDNSAEGTSTTTTHTLTINPARSGSIAIAGVVNVDSDTSDISPTAGTLVTGSEVDMGKETAEVAWVAESSGTAVFTWSKVAANDSYAAAVSFYEPVVISGTSDMRSSGTVKMAINGTLNANTGTIYGGAWSIYVPAADVTSTDVITVWRDATVDDTTESTAITKYDGTGDITGMVLNANVLSIGSADNPSLVVSDFGYDCLDDEDVMHNATTTPTTLEVEGVGGACSNSYTDEKINILSGSTLTIAGTETLTTHNVLIDGTLLANSTGGNATFNVSGNWSNNGTFTASTSTVNFNGAGSSTQCVNNNTTFNNFTGSPTSARTIRFAYGSTQTVSGTWNISGSAATLTLDEASTAPSQVTGLSAVYDSATKITLNWSAPADNDCVTSFKVYRSSPTNGSYALLESGGCSGLGNVLACTDTGLTEDTLYYYKVSAVNAAGEGTQSSEVSATPQCTLLLGAQIWMCKNMNVGTRVDSSAEQNQDSTVEKYCYSDTEANCTTDGGLYQWAEAMQLANSCNTTDCSGSINTPHQGICPLGYHIPTDTEWTTLTDYLNTSTYQCNETSTYIAKSLASTSGWTTSVTSCAVGNTQSSNNTSGFAAIPSGYYSTGSFYFRSDYGYLWSASQNGATNSWFRRLYYPSGTVDRNFSGKQVGFPVRCLKD